jgi:hypothetical protein
VPNWLEQAGRSPGTAKFELTDILKDSLFYPACEFDGTPIKHFSGLVPFLTVRFADGITATSRALAINTTYSEGWLSGGPDAAWNARYLEDLQHSYSKQYPDTVPYIVPVDAPIIGENGPMAFRRFQILPLIRLSAIFTNATNEYLDEAASHNLFVVWHQHDLTKLMSCEISDFLSKQFWSILTNTQ